jgi:pantetheine-phosphate adenylyltransferase
MRIAIYPGTFDPITNGHIDVIERGTRLFDKVVITVARNSSKTPLFSEEERISMAKEAMKDYEQVDVVGFQGLIVDYAQSLKAVAIIRGLRAVTDFEYEFQIALMNRKLSPTVTTVFLMPHERYTYLNSSIIRELARHKQDVNEFVAPIVAKKLKEKFQ